MLSKRHKYKLYDSEQDRAPNERLDAGLHANCKKAESWFSRYRQHPNMVYVTIRVPGRRRQFESYHFRLHVSQVDQFVDTAISQFQNKIGHRWTQSLQRMAILGFEPIPELPRRD